jgi:hypothetical protein
MKGLAVSLWVPVLAMSGVGFERQVVYSGGVVHSAQTVDYNSDGLKDLIFTADGGVNLALAPAFEVLRICETPAPLKPNSYHSAVLDMDGDGDMDFLGENNGLYWLECPDDPLSKAWELHWITRAFTGIHCITIHDVDEDGHPDIVVNNYWHRHQRKTIPNEYPASIVWFSIPEDPEATAAWQPRILADGNAKGGSHYMAFADVDGNGHDELLVGAKGKPFWWGNYFAYWSRGQDVSKPWSRTKLHGRHRGATHLYGADLTGDEKIDMVGSLGHGKGIMLFEAPGFKPIPIDKELVAPHAFRIADIEGDGDIDLFVCAKGSRKVQWFENDGNGKFRRHHLSDNQQSYDIGIDDLDADGDLDIIVAGHESRNIVLFLQNQGDY